MIVRMIHLYVMRIDTLVPMVLGGLLREASERDRSWEDLAHKFGWDEGEMGRLMRLEALPDIGGPVAFTIANANVEGLTLFQAARLVEAMVIAKLMQLPVNLLCRFIGRELESDVRHMRDRAVKFGLLRLDRHGRYRDM